MPLMTPLGRVLRSPPAVDPMTSPAPPVHHVLDPFSRALNYGWLPACPTGCPCLPLQTTTLELATRVPTLAGGIMTAQQSPQLLGRWWHQSERSARGETSGSTDSPKAPRSPGGPFLQEPRTEDRSPFRGHRSSNDGARVTCYYCRHSSAVPIVLRN